MILDRNRLICRGNGYPEPKVVSMKIENGKRNWTAPFGSNGNFWVAGKSLFFVSDKNELVRLKIETGETVWVTELSLLHQKRFRLTKKTVRHHGPIIAGNQLLIVSSDGYLRFYDPKTGEQKNKLQVKSGVTTNPIVANETLYFITQDGRLRAFR